MFEGSEGTCSKQWTSGSGLAKSYTDYCAISHEDKDKNPCVDAQPGTKCMFEGSEGTCSMQLTSGSGVAKGYSPFCDISRPDDVNKVHAAAKSTLKEPIEKGAQVLQVASNSEFAIGQEIILGKGTPMEEFNKIVGFGSLILETPLKFDHDAGGVVETKVAEDTEPATLGGATASVDAAG